MSDPYSTREEHAGHLDGLIAMEVDGLQSVTVTFCLDAATLEEATANLMRFLDRYSGRDGADRFGIIASVIEPMPTPGDLARRIIGGQA